MCVYARVERKEYDNKGGRKVKVTGIKSEGHAEYKNLSYNFRTIILA